MEDDDALLKYLFETSQEPRDELAGLFAGLARMEALEIEKKPLDQVLKGLDLGTAVVDPEGLSVSFSDVDAYRGARDKLFDPVALTNLATAGFVPAYGNDTAQANEVPKFVIYFIPIGECPGPDAKQLTPKQAAKQVAAAANRFQGDKTEVDKEFPGDGPKEKSATKESAAEGLVKGVLSENADALGDWINSWCLESGSMIEIWGDETQWAEIKQAVDSGEKVVAVDSREKANSMVDRGWTLIADEENGTEYDSVLVRKKGDSPKADARRPARRGFRGPG